MKGGWIRDGIASNVTAAWRRRTRHLPLTLSAQGTEPIKVSKRVVALTAIIIFLTTAVIGLLIYIKNLPPPTRRIEPLVEIVAMEPDSGK